MDSLQDIVKDRKQRRKQDYNQNYEQIVTNAINHRSLKIEKSIHDEEFSIVSRSDLSLTDKSHKGEKSH